MSYEYDELEKWYIEKGGKVEGVIDMITQNFPGAMTSVKNQLDQIGDNSTREGLIDTPFRVVKSWMEIFSGYEQDPAEILSVTFSEGMEQTADEIVICRNVEFYSMCEHHMLPFSGSVHIGYLPDKKVVGLSKLARLVDCFAKRLQIQEKMAIDIADAIVEHLAPEGVGVIINAEHLCMKMRGVKKRNSEMITSAMRGKFKFQAATRNEFLSLINM